MNFPPIQVESDRRGRWDCCSAADHRGGGGTECHSGGARCECAGCTAPPAAPEQVVENGYVIRQTADLGGHVVERFRQRGDV